MILHGIALQHIRSHAQLFVRLDQPTALIIGPNASGKTTIVEAIHLLSSGESFRAGKIDEMIQFGAEIGRVKGKIGQTSHERAGRDLDLAEHIDEVEVLLTPGEVQGKRTSKRLYVVNGVRRQKKTATSFFSSVVFRPEDMRLIEGSPSRRRAFLDAPLAHLFPEYERSLHAYEQTLLRRNKLLTQIREHEQPASTLEFWNLSLIKHGEMVQKHRQEFMQFLHTVEFPLTFGVTYQPSIISADRLREYVPREIAAGHTLIGPHKDDFIVEITKIAAATTKELRTLNVALFGSRGEQRLAVLWLKFGELAFLQKKTDRAPLLLLDDILSELDSDSQQLALSVLSRYQTVITTIDPDLRGLVANHAPGLQEIQLEKIV